MFHSRCSWRPTSGVNQYNAQWVIPLLDKYLFLSYCFPRFKQFGPVSCLTLIYIHKTQSYFAILCSKNHFSAPTFWSPCRQWFGRVFARFPPLLVCRLQLVLIFTHKQKQETQTCKIKKKKTIKTNYDKNICLLYMCTSLYSRWNRTYWNIKMDKRTWFLKYNNLWKIKKFTIFGLRIDLKFLITTWKNFENLSSSQTHYFHISSWCFD